MPESCSSVIDALEKRLLYLGVHITHLKITHIISKKGCKEKKMVDAKK
jgi:hypothetical protein